MANRDGCEKNAPASRGVFVCSTRLESGAGCQRQAIGAQDRTERLEEAAAIPMGALTTAAAAREHTLRLTRAGNERAARVAAFGAGGSAGQVQDRFAGAVADGHAGGFDRAALP